MVTPATSSGETHVWRPCARAFFVHFLAMALCFFGPLINPEVKIFGILIPPKFWFLLGLFILALVAYQWTQEYRVTSRGVEKIWRWPAREQHIPWENLGEVSVRRGFTQTMLRVGNLMIRDKTGGPEMLWFGLKDPKEVMSLLESSRQ